MSKYKNKNKKVKPIICEGEEFDSDSEFEVVNLDREIFLNPFHLVGIWTKKQLEGISIESTLGSALDQSQSTKQKFIEAPIRFSNEFYNSQTIRVDDVMIPCSKENGYGQEYLYICLSHDLEKILTSTFETRFKNLKPAKFEGKEGEWWKTIFGIKDVFHVIKKRQKSTPISIRKIMRCTQKGVRANLVLEFSLCTRTDEKGWNWKFETTILVKAKSGYVTSIDVDIEPPTPLGSIPGKPMLKDIASDEDLNNFSKLII
ncbi:hypothetical protein OnM2_020105 [Erysiphe neolycopersici]|uniref:Uncharacterized protein n=1 Tax=Erysiphe neolycopersici TaxID=212602 RepID=A0A420I3P2_9PEZI|nr:hypothetical protein OnM2_020105 [Erysiphe neolycopersici]